MSKGPVSQYVEQQVLLKLARSGVLVWYDPAGAFADLVDNLNLPAGTTVVRFRGSYYRLRAEADASFARLNRSTAATEPGLLVYVPAPPLQRELDVLLGLSKAGDRFDSDLPTLAREALRDRFAQAHLDELLGNTALTLAELDQLATGGSIDAGGVISVIFGAVGSHEVVARYLTEPDLEQVVAEKGALSALASLAARSFGFAADNVNSQGELRERLARHLLLTEFRADLAEGVEIPALASLPMPNKTQVAACREAVRYMRDRASMQDRYVELAERVEAAYHLSQLGLSAAELGESETFPFAEWVRLASLEELIQQGAVVEALERVATRRQSFWSRRDSLLAVQWQVAETALALYGEAQRVHQAVKEGADTPAELTLQYTAADQGWYRIDLLHRVLERDVSKMEEEFHLQDLLQQARRAYHQAAEALIDRYVTAVADQGFQFGGVALQSDIFARFVTPYLGEELTAYFLVDALRFEMGVDLARLIRNAEGVQVTPAVATAPTITPIGMAALMPGAEKGLAVVDTSSGKVAAQVDGAVLPGVKERKNLLSAVTGHSTLELTLDELLRRTRRTSALKKELADKRLVVVRSTEIDAQGEQDRVQHARKAMTDVLDDLKKAVNWLAAVGVRRFVITSDHGHLFGEELVEPMKIDPPGGETLELHRRCWIGKGGSSGHGFVRFRAADLGLQGDLEFAFPRGLGAFKVPGGTTAYYHGGLSPQELIVPVITFRMPAPKADPEGERVVIQAAPERVTNRFFTITLLYHASLISAATRRVRCLLLSDGQQVGRAATAQAGYDSASQEVTLEAARENVVTMLFTEERPQGELVVQVRDADTDAILDEKGPCLFEFTS